MKLVIPVLLLMLIGCHTSELRALQAEHELDAARMDELRAEMAHLAPCQPTK